MMRVSNILQYVLDSLPYIGPLRKQIQDQGVYPAGHYYSPIPKQEDVLAYLGSTNSENIELPDVDLNKQEQFEHLTAFERLYDQLPFTEKPVPENRYYYDQSWFSYADGIFLYSFLRHTTPKRIIEVGAGFTSALILDTAEKSFQHQPEITVIEPYPERMRQLLRPGDERNIRMIEREVQEVPIDLFRTLSSGDLLFIDSSHVIKYGSDVQFLMFKVLPTLTKGVFVHFHDVYYPFDYPAWLLLQGKYWNEDYFLRAFLSYNSEWKIYFFNTYVAHVFADFIHEKMPLCLKNPGGSLYIRRNPGG